MATETKTTSDPKAAPTTAPAAPPATAPKAAPAPKAYTQRQQLWLTIFSAALQGGAADVNTTFSKHTQNAIETANKGIAKVEEALARI